MNIYVYFTNTINKIRQFFQLRKKIGWFSLSRNSIILGRARVHSFVLLNKVVIGDMSYVANFSRLTNCQVGKFTSIGPNVHIGLGIHPSTWVSTHPAFFSTRMQARKAFVSNSRFLESKEVLVGNDVWIGDGALILDGVIIGDGAIIGAGAVVTHNIPPYAIAVGVPAKVIKYRFSVDDIEYFSRLQWWDRSDAWLVDHANYFDNVELFKKILAESGD